MRQTSALVAALLVIGAAPLEVPPALVAAMMRDPIAADCLKESGKTPQRYVDEGFGFKSVALRSGEQMTVVVAMDGCMAVGQSTRVMIYQRTAAGYRRVLNTVSIVDGMDVDSEGTALFPTHDTMQTILESVYVWNGNTYVFSPARSRIYDLEVQQRRPYETPVRLRSGASQTTISGTVAYYFGNRYVIAAKAGQMITIELTRHGGPHPYLALWYDGSQEPIADGIGSRWSGVLTQSGTYDLFVSGDDERNPAKLWPYSIRLSVR